MWDEKCGKGEVGGHQQMHRMEVALACTKTTFASEYVFRMPTVRSSFLRLSESHICCWSCCHLPSAETKLTMCTRIASKMACDVGEIMRAK